MVCEKEPKNSNCLSIEVSRSVFSMLNMPRAVLETYEYSKETFSIRPIL